MKKLSILRAAHENGISVADVAKKLGISTRALSARSKGNPTLNSLYEIARAIGCDITDLFQ